MGNTRNTGYLQNTIKVSDAGAISFMSGSTMLATINTSGQMSGSAPVLFASTASFVANAQTASFVALAQSASNAVSAQTASFANAFTVASTLTAQTLVVQTITSSVDFVTGSTRFGSVIGNTHVFTGSVSITGSLAVVTTGTEFQVTNTGVNFGNVIGDTHNITGSVGISGSLSGIGATFSGEVSVPNGLFSINGNAVSGPPTGGVGIRHVNNRLLIYGGTTDITFQKNSNTGPNLTILESGAATFASSVTATTAILQSANTAAVVDILLLTNPSAASSGVRQRFANGYGDLAAIKVSQRDNGALADDGQIEFQVASNSVLNTKLTILNTGNATFTNDITAAGNISANNIKLLSFTLQGLSTPVSTGLPINAYSGGRTYLLLTSQQWSDGNSTSSTVTMIRCGYDGNNFSVVVLGSSNATAETWSQSGGILYVTGNTNFQLDIAVLSNG
jgi:hypothetical protein